MESSSGLVASPCYEKFISIVKKNHISLEKKIYRDSYRTSIAMNVQVHSERSRRRDDQQMRGMRDDSFAFFQMAVQLSQGTMRQKKNRYIVDEGLRCRIHQGLVNVIFLPPLWFYFPHSFYLLIDGPYRAFAGVVSKEGESVAMDASHFFRPLPLEH